MSGEKYKVLVAVTFEVEFEDDGDLSLTDQAHAEAVSRFSPNEVWDAEVIQFGPVPAASDQALPA